MRFVDWRDVRITDALGLHSRSGEVLVEGEFPIVWSYEDRDRRLILVAFDLERSNFALQPAFPIFFVNVLEWLSGAPALAVEAGVTVTVPAGLAREAVLRGPEGDLALRAQDRRFVTPPLDRAGLYTVRSHNRTWRFVARATVPESIPAASPAVAAPADVRPGARDIASVGLAVFLGLLLIEWWVYVRPGLRRRGGAARPVKP
jgi:hypothetical protein